MIQGKSHVLLHFKHKEMIIMFIFYHVFNEISCWENYPKLVSLNYLKFRAEMIRLLIGILSTQFFQEWVVKNRKREKMDGPVKKILFLHILRFKKEKQKRIYLYFLGRS